MPVHAQPAPGTPQLRFGPAVESAVDPSVWPAPGIGLGWGRFGYLPALGGVGRDTALSGRL